MGTMVELSRLVKRENELERELLAFSVSHNCDSVRIYGLYPVITGGDIKYYRHMIRRYAIIDRDGKDKWTAYRFTRNLYDLWMPKHFQRICSAIDQLPSNLDFDVPLLPETGLARSTRTDICPAGRRHGIGVKGDDRPVKHRRPSDHSRHPAHGTGGGKVAEADRQYKICSDQYNS